MSRDQSELLKLLNCCKREIFPTVCSMGYYWYKIFRRKDFLLSLSQRFTKNKINVLGAMKKFEKSQILLPYCKLTQKASVIKTMLCFNFITFSGFNHQSCSHLLLSFLSLIIFCLLNFFNILHSVGKLVNLWAGDVASTTKK